MAIALEELILQFSIDSDGLEKGLDSVSARARAKAKEIEGMAIAPKVDLKGLHDLNKLLDIKQRHIKETADFAKRTPIVMGVDVSQIKESRKELQGLKADLGMSGGSQTIRVKVEHDYKIDVRESNRDIAHQIKDLGSGLRDIVAAVKSTKQGIVSKTVGGLVGAVASTPLAIARGALEGIGSSIAKDIGVGAKQEIESVIADKFGSSKAIGKTIAKKAIVGISSRLESLSDFIDSELENEISIRTEKKKKDPSTKEQILSKVQQARDFVSQSSGSFVDQNLKTREARINALSDENRERSERSKANKGLYAQQGSSIRVSKAIESLDNLDLDYQDRENKLKATLAKVNKQVADIGLVVSKLESDLSNAVSKGDMATAKKIKEKIDTKLSEELKLSNKIAGLVPVVNSLALEKQKELQAILDASSLSPKELEKVAKIRKNNPKIALVDKDINALDSAIESLEKKKRELQKKANELGKNDTDIESVKKQVELYTVKINELTTKSLSGKPQVVMAKQFRSIDKEINGLKTELDNTLKELIKEYNKNRPEELAVLEQQKSRMKQLKSLKTSFQKEVKLAHPDKGGSKEQFAAVVSKYQKEVVDFALSIEETLDPNLSVKEAFSVLNKNLGQSIKSIENNTIKSVAENDPTVKAIQGKIKAKHKEKADLKPIQPQISQKEVEFLDQKIGELQAEKNELVKTLSKALVDSDTRANIEILMLEADKQILAFEKTKKDKVQKRDKLLSSKVQFDVQSKSIAKEVTNQKLPTIVKQIMESVGGGKLPDTSLVPKIVVNDKKLKGHDASGLYDVALNQIIVTKALHERLKNNQLTLEDIETLVHESQHFIDFDAGSAEGLEARNQGRIRGKKVKARTPEIERQARQEASFYSPEKREYELNAKISGKNKAPMIHEQYQKDIAQQKLFSIGKGGEQIIKELTSIKDLKATINSLLQEMDSVKLPESYDGYVDRLTGEIIGAQNVAEKIRTTLKKLFEHEQNTFADNASPEFVEKIIEKLEGEFAKTKLLMKSFDNLSSFVEREMSLLDPFSSFGDKVAPFSKNIPTNKNYTHVPMAPDPFGTNDEYNNSDFKKWHTDKSLIEQYTKIGKQATITDPVLAKEVQELIKSQPTGFMPVKTNIFGQRTERVIHSIPDPFGDESPEEYINSFNQLGGSKDLAVRENKPSRNVTGHQDFTRKRVGILSDLSAQMDNLEYLKAVTVKEFEKIQKKSDPYANKLSKSDIEKQSTKLIASVNELQNINTEIALVGQKMKDRIATFNEHSGNVESIESMLDQASNLEDFALLQKAKRQIAENIKSVRKDTNMDAVTKSILTSQYKDLAGKAKIDSKFVAMPSIKEMASLPMQSIETFTDMAREGLATVQNKASELGTEFVETVTHALTTALHESQLLIQQAKSNPIGLLGDAGQTGLALANKGARAIAPAAAGTYGIMRGAEKALFSLSEFKAFGVGVNLAEVVKAIMQTSAGVALMHSAPVVGELFQAVGGGVGHLAGGAVHSELAGHLIQETPKLAEGAGLLARTGHALSTQAVNASNAAVTPVIEGVTQITTAVTSAAVEFVTEIVALLTTGKITVDHAKKMLEAQTVDEFKALAPAVNETIQKTQIQVTDFGEKYREARKLIGEGTGYNRRLGENIGSIVHLLPESQQSIALKAAPILSDVEKAYSGDLDYQKEYNIPGLKGMGTKQFENLPKFVQKAVKEQIVMMFNSVEQAKREVEANLSGLVGDEKKGILSDINTGLGSKLKALQEKGKKLGIGEERLKIEKLSDLPSVDVSSRPVIDLSAPEIQSMPDLSAIGKNLGEGVNEGLTATIPVTIETVDEYAETALNKPLKKALKIESPSKLWKQFAKWMGLGTILGIKESIPDVKKATEEMAKAATPKMPDGFLPLPKLPPEFTQKVKEAEERRLHFEGVQLSDQYKPTGDKNLDALLKQLRESSNKIDKAIADIAVNANAELGTAIASGNQRTIDSNKALLKSIQETYNQVSVAQDKQDIDSGNLVRNSYKKLQKLVDLYALEPVGSLPDAEEVNALVQRLSEKAKKLDNATDIIDQVSELQQSGYSLKDAKRIAQDNDPNALLGVRDDLSRMFGKLREQFPIVDQGIEKLRTLKSTIVTLGAAGLGIIGLVLIGKQLSNIAIESVKVYRNFESIFIASKLIGDGEKYIQSMQKQVLKLGGDLESTLRQGVGFASAAIGTPLENVSQQMFLDSSKSLQLLGIQGQQYDSALLGLKQVASKGRVSLEEISSQLGESVPGILPMVAAALNTNVQGAIQMIESGNVLSEELLPKLVQQMKARTQSLEPIYEKSLTAATGRIGAGTEVLQLELGKNLTTIILPAINLVGDGIIGISENLDTAVLVAKLFTSTLVGVTAINAFPFLVSGATSLIKMLHGINLTWGMIGKTSLVALNIMKAGLVGLTGVFAFDAVTASFSKGSANVVAANEAIANSYKKIREEKEKNNNTPDSSPVLGLFDNAVESWNKGLQPNTLIGKIGGSIGTFRESERLKNNDLTESSLNVGYQKMQISRVLEDSQAVTDYINQADKIEKLRAEKQGRAQALRIEDAQKFAKEIAKIDKEVNGPGGLFEQRAKLDEQFLPGGKAGLEELIAAFEQVRKTASSPMQEASAGKAIAVLTNRVDILSQAEERLSNGINKQRLAWISLNGEIALSNQLLQSQIVNSKTALLKRQADGEIGEVLASQLNAQLDVSAQQKTVNALIKQQRETEKYIETQIQSNPESTVRTLLKKRLIDSTAKDIKELELKIAGDSKLKSAIGDQVLQPLQEYVGRKAEVENALQAVEQARLAARQNASEVASSQRELARSLVDFNLDMKRQSIDYTQQIEAHRREIEDAGIQASRENRDLAESFSDLMLDLKTQLKSAQNEFIDIQDKIKNTQLKRELLEISPGIDSYGKQIATIFANLREALSGNESEARSLEMKQEQIGRDYVNTLRKIRSEQERQYDAERMRTRAIADLAIKTVQLAMNLEAIILGATRRADDMNRENNRNNKGMPWYQDKPAQAPNFPKANFSQQQAPVLNPIVYQGQNSIVPTRTGYDPSFHLPALNESLSVQEQFNLQVPKRNTQPIPVSFAQPAPISVGIKINMKPDELEMMKRLVLAEAGGEGESGMAGVARAILNRHTMINQHGLSPSNYFAKSGSLRDIMTARSPKTGKAQFSPFDDGSINKAFTPQQMALAEQAIALALNTPEFKNLMRSQGLNESQVGRMTNATGFRNRSIATDDPSQNHNTVKFRNHTFNSDQFSKNKLRAFNFDVPTEYENVAGLNGMAVPKQPQLVAGNWITDGIKNIKNFTNRGRKNWTLENWKKEFDLFKKDKDWTLVMLREWIKNQFIETGNVDVKVLQELNAMIVQQEKAEKKVWTRHRELLEQKNSTKTSSLPPVRTDNFRNNKQPQVTKKPVTTKPVTMPKVEEHRLQNAQLQRNNQLVPSSLFSGEMVSFRKRKIEDLLRLVTHIEGESESLITKGVVDALNAGKLGKSVKFEWLNLTQQQVENYIKSSDTNRDATIKQILSKPRPKTPRLTPVINEVLKAEQQQNKTQPKTKKATVSAPKQRVQAQPVFAPINVAEQINYGINPTYPQVPNFGYGNAFDLNEQLDTQKRINIEAEKELNIEQRKLIVAQQIEEMARMQYTLIDTNKSNERFVDDAIYSAKDMLANAKGYLTVQEQIAKSVADVNGQYRSQLRSLEDQRESLTRLAGDWEKRIKDAQLSLDDKDKILTPEQREQITKYVAELERNLNKIRNPLTGEGQIKDIDQLIKSLNISNQINVNSTYLLETENKRIESLTKIADLEANIATARYNQGGTLINEASIIKARIDGIKMIRDAERAYKEDNSLGADFVTKTKELADINLSQSYVDAIPFLKEFSANLKDVILQTTTWQDALKKTLDLVAGTVLNQMVILPFQNAIAGFAKNLGLFGNFAEGTDYFIPNYANGIDEALSRERAMNGGKQAYIAALTVGEAVLTDIPEKGISDSALYRNLKRSGQWDELKTGDQIPNFARGTDSTVNSGKRSQSSNGGRNGGGGTVVINHNQTIVTPNADSFNSGKRQRNQDLMVQLNKSLGR